MRKIGIKVPKRIPEAELQAIEAVVRDHPMGISIHKIVNQLKTKLPRRTLQYRLQHLVEQNRLVKTGKKRWTTYHLPGTRPTEKTIVTEDNAVESEPFLRLSKAGIKIQHYLRRPVAVRKPVGFNRNFLTSYRPNKSAYLSTQERQHLRELGQATAIKQAAGTFAKQILNRLLIDLSWNSSRLEGNTYSLLDTKRLIAFGQEAEGKTGLDAQMILNHKDAIEFLVQTTEEIGFNRYAILNLHAMLANNLLADPEAAGRLRRIAVGIEKSAFHPLEVPQLIEECFDQLLATASAIEDPFEQSFFIMVHLPYLQPFDDVNKRVSRLAANIPLIRSNLSPLSFIDVPLKTYTEGILGIYELNQIELLRDIYIWAYERSASRYIAILQSLGEPDPFRLKHRGHLQQLVGQIIRDKMSRKTALQQISTWSRENIDVDERESFRELVEKELLSLHEGNFARYRIRPSEFQAWQKIWQEI